MAKNTSIEALDRATKAAGTGAELARRIGVGPMVITQWKARGHVPVEHRPAIELATGVRCEEFGGGYQWQRDRKGKVTGYVTPIPAPLPQSDEQKLVA